MKKINFIPPGFLYERRKHRRNTLLTTALFAVFAASLVWSGVSVTRTVFANSALQQMRSAAREAQNEAARVASLQQQRNRLAASLRLSRELEGMLPLTIILSTIEQSMPEGAGLEELRLLRREGTQDTKNRKGNRNGGAREHTPDHIVVEVVGVWPNDESVARFTAALSRNALFQNVKIIDGVPFEDDGIVGRKFHIYSEISMERRFVFGEDTEAL